jgi:DinB superfamily
MAMREKERKLLARVETHRREIIAEADRLTADQLTFRPAPNAWSALEVLEHLVKVEEAIAARVRPREPRGPLETVRAKAALCLMRVLFVARRRIRVPVQTILPLGGVTLSDLAGRWEAAQAVLRERLETFGAEDWSRPMMRHPLIGRLIPAESLNFIHWHMGHHQRQIARIRRAQSYPRP